MNENKTPTLYVMVGISGIGKTTFAKKMGCPVISTDRIREKMFGDERNQAEPSKVFQRAYKTLNWFIRNGLDVVFDATNTTHRGRRQIIRAVRYPCKKVAVLMSADLDKALRQNQERDRQVPEDVIRRQYMQLMRDSESIPAQFDDVIFAKETVSA